MVLFVNCPGQLQGFGGFEKLGNKGDEEDREDGVDKEDKLALCFLFFPILTSLLAYVHCSQFLYYLNDSIF